MKYANVQKSREILHGCVKPNKQLAVYRNVILGQRISMQLNLIQKNATLNKLKCKRRFYSDFTANAVKPEHKTRPHCRQDRIGFYLEQNSLHACKRDYNIQ